VLKNEIDFFKKFFFKKKLKIFKESKVDGMELLHNFRIIILKIYEFHIKKNKLH
jgi:hypothetical protein